MARCFHQRPRPLVAAAPRDCRDGSGMHGGPVGLTWGRPAVGAQVMGEMGGDLAHAAAFQRTARVVTWARDDATTCV